MQLVSVIIPIFNRASTFRITLDSIVNQTYKNIEIIIVDDCSNDYNELKELINSYEDSRIKLLQNNKNMNGAYSRNIGIKIAKGDFIALMDSDDTWQENKIEKQIEKAKSLSTDLYLITCKSKVIRRTFSEELPIYSIKQDEKISDFLFVNNGYMPTPSLFLTTSVAKKCLFNEKLRRHQDYDFLLRLESMGVKFYTIEEALVTVYANHIETSEKRGANYKVSEIFLNDYSQYFTKKAKNYFWIKNVGFYMSRNNEKQKLFKELLFKGKFKGIDIKTLIIYILYFIFINTRLYSLVEKIYLKVKKLFNGEKDEK